MASESASERRCGAVGGGRWGACVAVGAGLAAAGAGAEGDRAGHDHDDGARAREACESIAGRFNHVGVFLVRCGCAEWSGESRTVARHRDPIKRGWVQPSTLRLRCGIDAPDSRRAHSRRPVELVAVTPADLSAALLDIVTSIVDRRRAAEPGCRAGRPDHRRRSPRASEEPRARRLGLERRDAAGEAARRQPARARRRRSPRPHPAIDGVASAEVAGPGFINFRLDAAAAGQLAKTIVDAGEAFGNGSIYAGIPINLEFVSANPTGPIHMGGVRWAAVGDSLARILAAEGADVTREYYFNDHGSQIDRFARSLLAAYLGEPTPEDGYGGAYIGDIAAQVVERYDGDIASLPREQQQEVFRSMGTELMFAEIKSKLHGFGVDFDVYFHEDSLHESGAVERAIERLREQGHIFEEDGAVWLRTTTFGDDRDRVIIRSNGEPAYISGDLGYYLNKRERGFEQNLIMLGADHHGYVGRLMAAVEAFGDTPGRQPADPDRPDGQPRCATASR